MALVAVTNPLPLEDPLPPKRGGGYVELGDHVVVCSLCGFEDGFGVATCLAVLTGLLVVAGRFVVEVTSGVSRPRLWCRGISTFLTNHVKKISERKKTKILTDNCNCSLSFVAGVVGSIPCCFSSKANKAAGFASVDDAVVVDTVAWLLKIALRKASSSSLNPRVVAEVLVSNIKDLLQIKK